MEVKKKPGVNLERYRGVLLQFGFILAIGFALLAFEWSSGAGGLKNIDNSKMEGETDFELPPVTRQDYKPPTPPPASPQIENILTIVDDEVEIDDEYEVEDLSTDMEDIIVPVDLTPDEPTEEPVFFIVEENPEFPGGHSVLLKWLASNTVYPALAREQGIQGKVYVRFCVTKHGEVDKVSVARGVDPLLDAEALRVVKKLPKWKPGMQRGKPVNVWHTVPIHFVLN